MRLVCQITFLLLYQISTLCTCPTPCNCTTKADNQQTINCSGVDINTLDISMLTNVTSLILSNVNLNDDALLKTKVMNLTRIKELDLSSNHFQDLPKQTATLLKHLMKLVLKNNSIALLSEDVIELSKNFEIDLTDNPINCNCSTVSIISKSNKLNLIGNCSSPQNRGEAIELKQLKASTLDCDPCNNNGPCIFGICVVVDAVEFKCNCTDDIIGRLCNQVLTPAPDACTIGSVCKNGGTCIAHGPTNYTCVCPSHTSGIRCQLVESNSFDDDLIIAIIVTGIVFVLVGISAYVYFKKIKPKRRKRRKSSSASRRRSVQFDVVSIGNSRKTARLLEESTLKRVIILSLNLFRMPSSINRHAAKMFLE